MDRKNAVEKRSDRAEIDAPSAMKLSLFLLISALLSAIPDGCRNIRMVPPPPAKPKPGQHSVLSQGGPDTVTVSMAGKPVANAAVFVGFESALPYEARTDENGVARFTVKHKQLIHDISVQLPGGEWVTLKEGVENWPIRIEIPGK